MFGVQKYGTDAEAAALTQWNYYEVTANRKKTLQWSLRSPSTLGETFFVGVNGSGNVNIVSAVNTKGIVPFGCI